MDRRPGSSDGQEYHDKGATPRKIDNILRGMIMAGQKYKKSVLVQIEEKIYIESML